VVWPVAWRDIYDEPQMARLFGLKPGDLYLKGISPKGDRWGGVPPCRAPGLPCITNNYIN